MKGRFLKDRIENLMKKKRDKIPKTVLTKRKAPTIMNIKYRIITCDDNNM